MIDVSDTIIAKSDQLNADDLVEPITIKVDSVTKTTVNGEKTFTVKYQGDEGRPFKPCKTVRRILVRAWGKDASAWAGRAMTLYNDPTVRWAGKPVGGIRVSHLSDIDGPLEISLAETRGMKKPHKILPLAVDVAVQGAPPAANPPPKQQAESTLPNALRLIKTDGSLIEFDSIEDWLGYITTNLPKIEDLDRINSFKEKHNEIFEEIKALGFAPQVETALNTIKQNAKRLGAEDGNAEL